jgi:hypothetical protein
MKKVVLGLSVFFALNTQAQSVVTFDDLTLAPNSHYDGSDGSGGFTSNGIFFENTYDTSWSFWSSGFIYSNSTDNTTPGYTNDFSAITGIGGNNSANYGVNYAGNIDLGAAYVVSELQVTNTTYAYLSMRDGDGIGKKFGDSTNADGALDGTNGEDFFRLIIVGKDANQLITDSVIYYLADFRFDDNNLDYIIDSWETIDLLPLGSVRYLEFTLESSDVGQFGMNTPAYFALDNLTYGNLSSEQLSDEVFTAFPNPCISTIQFQNAAGTCVIRDINGRILTTQTISSSTPTDVSFLQPGNYWYEVISETGKSYGSFVKL